MGVGTLVRWGNGDGELGLTFLRFRLLAFLSATCNSKTRTPNDLLAVLTGYPAAI